MKYPKFSIYQFVLANRTILRAVTYDNAVITAKIPKDTIGMIRNIDLGLKITNQTTYDIEFLGHPGCLAVTESDIKPID